MNSKKTKSLEKVLVTNNSFIDQNIRQHIHIPTPRLTIPCLNMPASLYYYKATGRANAIRLALAAANIPFNDVYPEGGFPPSDKVKVR